MTAKRFTKGYHTIRDTYENKTYDFRVNVICDLLNELDEENGQLKADKQSLIDFIKKEFGNVYFGKKDSGKLQDYNP